MLGRKFGKYYKKLEELRDRIILCVCVCVCVSLSCTFMSLLCRGTLLDLACANPFVVTFSGPESVITSVSLSPE